MAQVRAVQSTDGNWLDTVEYRVLTDCGAGKLAGLTLEASQQVALALDIIGGSVKISDFVWLLVRGYVQC